MLFRKHPNANKSRNDKCRHSQSTSCLTSLTFEMSCKILPCSCSCSEQVSFKLLSTPFQDKDSTLLRVPWALTLLACNGTFLLWSPKHRHRCELCQAKNTALKSGMLFHFALFNRYTYPMPYATDQTVLHVQKEPSSTEQRLPPSSISELRTLFYLP